MGTGECVGDCAIEGRPIADFPNRLQSRRKISPVVPKHGSASADLRLARWRFGVGPKVIVKTPRANPIAKRQHLRGPSGLM